MKQLKNILPVLGIGAITLLTQLTMSGSSVGFESEELSNIGSNITSGAGSLIHMIIQLLPWIIFLTIIGFVVKIIFGFGKLKTYSPDRVLWSENRLLYFNPKTKKSVEKIENYTKKGNYYSEYHVKTKKYDDYMSSGYYEYFRE